MTEDVKTPTKRMQKLNQKRYELWGYSTPDFTIMKAGVIPWTHRRNGGRNRRVPMGLFP